MQKSLRPRVAELFRYLKSKGLTISLDTNDDPEDRWEGGLHQLLRHVDVFLPNAREACKTAGTENLDEAIDRLSEMVPKRTEYLFKPDLHAGTVHVSLLFSGAANASEGFRVHGRLPRKRRTPSNTH